MTINMVDFAVNSFYLMRKISFEMFLAFILLEKLDLG
jgi:hypothetical protein